MLHWIHGTNSVSIGIDLSEGSCQRFGHDASDVPSVHKQRQLAASRPERNFGTARQTPQHQPFEFVNRRRCGAPGFQSCLQGRRHLRLTDVARHLQQEHVIPVLTDRVDFDGSLAPDPRFGKFRPFVLVGEGNARFWFGNACCCRYYYGK